MSEPRGLFSQGTTAIYGLALSSAAYLGSWIWWTQPPKRSYAVPETENLKQGKGPIYRHPAYKDKLVDRFAGGEQTLYESFQHGVKNFGSLPCLGYRPEVGKDAKGTPIAGPFKWITYNEANRRLHNFGSGLLNLNLVPIIAGTAVTGPMRLLGFYVRNRPEWIIAEQGGYSQNVTTVPLYDTLGANIVEMIVNETEMTTILCTPKELKLLIQIKDHCTSLQNLICLDEIPQDLRDLCNKKGIRLFSFEDVERSGQEYPRAVALPSPDSISTFCYTSGTTGKCKGALLTHRNVISDVVAVSAAGSMLGPSDRILSYLPLAHCFERCVEALCFYSGSRVGYFQGDALRLADDIKALRPTAFASVPRLLNRMYDKVMDGIKSASPMKAKMFNMAYQTKLANLKNGKLTHMLWDRLIFHKVAGMMGMDQCRYIFTGSAPLAPHVHDFLRAALSLPVVQGYGQTETSAGSSVQAHDDFTCDTVGMPMPCNEIRLVSVDEMQYRVTDTIHGEEADAAGNKGVPCLGRGEICCRGNNVFKGYYKMDAMTKEAMDSEGWVHTGDIGMWTADGLLKVIDRKKNIFKLCQGEYIAPEKVENVYAKCPYVAQSFVHGDSYQARCVGIIVPNEAPVLKWAAEHGLAGKTFVELCAHPPAELLQAILADLDRVRKEARLLTFEHVAAIALDSNPFTMANGLLTPTFKLVRGEAKKAYKAQIDLLYKHLASLPDAKK